MGNTPSRLADNDGDHNDSPMNIAEDHSSDNENLASEPDDWSADEQGERVVCVPSTAVRSADPTLSFGERFAELQLENNVIANAFKNELRWVKMNGTNILSAWLVASKIYRDAHASRKNVMFQDISSIISDNWREVVKRGSTQAVKDAAHDHYRLGHDTSYLDQRLDYPGSRSVDLVRRYLQDGFDLQDLTIALERVLNGVVKPTTADVKPFMKLFDTIAPDQRILQVVPVLQTLYQEGVSPVPSLPPYNQLRNKPSNSFRSLLATLRNARRNSSSPPLRGISPEQDFIRFGSPTPPSSPSANTPVEINNKILTAFCEDFRWLERRRWPPQVSWRLVSALVHSQMALLDGDVDQAIANLYRAIPGYSKDRLDIITALNAWRHRVLTVELIPLLETLPNADSRRRLREVMDDAIRRNFDFHWLVAEWNQRTASTISRRQSVAALNIKIEEFHEWLSSLNAERILEIWVPKLFDCLDEDSEHNGEDDDDEDDQDEKLPYKTIESIFGQQPSLEDMLAGNTDDDGSEERSSDDDEDMVHSGNMYDDGGHYDHPADYDDGDGEDTPQQYGDDDDDEEEQQDEESGDGTPSDKGLIGPTADERPSATSPEPSLSSRATSSSPCKARRSPSMVSPRYTSPTLPHRTPRPLSGITASPSVPKASPPTPRNTPWSPVMCSPTPSRPFSGRDAHSSSRYNPRNRLDAHHPPENDSRHFPIPSSPRPTDIQGPSSPPFDQAFDALRNNNNNNNIIITPRPRAPATRRPRSRHRDPRIPRVDPLRYQNRLEEPRRLPNTPTVSHQPPRPRSHASSPEPRACPTCRRAFRNRVAKPGKKAGPKKAGSTTAMVVEGVAGSGRYPTRTRKSPKKFGD